MKQTKLLMLAMALGASGAMAQSVVVVLNDGTQQKFATDYVKEIYFTEESGPSDEMPLMLTEKNVYSNGNVLMSFSPATEELNVVLDIYGPTDALYLNPGTYEVNGTYGPFTIGNNIQYSYIDFVENGVGKVGLESGTATVTMSEDYVYTIHMDFMLTDGSNFKGVFVGEIPGYDPNAAVIDITMSAAEYNENPQPAGTFYVILHDADWGCQMALDIMSTPDATRLPAGTYTYSKDSGEMTFGGRSYLEIYTPYSYNELTGGTVVVAEEGGVYTIDMQVTLTDGREATLSYSGEITGTPNFDTGTIGDETLLDLVNTQVYSQGNATFVFRSDAEDLNVSLDLYGPTDAQYLYEGTYTIDAACTPYTINSDARYTYLQKGDSEDHLGIQSGTATVTMTADYVYTIMMDFVMADGSTFKGNFTGEIPDYNPGKGIEITLSDAKYNDNPQPAGNFYVKFNDADWSCEMAIDFMSTPDATVLPAGTYTYSAEGGEMTFSSKSYLDIYTPYTSNRFTAGTITVAEENGVYAIDMDLTLEDGRNARLIYSGAISGTPVFE